MENIIRNCGRKKGQDDIGGKNERDLPQVMICTLSFRWGSFRQVQVLAPTILFSPLSFLLPFHRPTFELIAYKFMACLETVSFEAHGVVRPSIVIPAKLGYSHRHMELELF